MAIVRFARPDHNSVCLSPQLEDNCLLHSNYMSSDESSLDKQAALQKLEKTLL